MKPATPKTGCTRLLGLLHMWYRSWSSKSVQAAMQWQERWTPQFMTGCRKLHDCADNWWTRAPRTEWAVMLDLSTAGTIIDRVKCDDKRPQTFLVTLAPHVGLDPPQHAPPIQLLAARQMPL